METAIYGTLFILTILVTVLIVRSRYKEPSNNVEAVIRNEFLRFQSNIHAEMEGARRGVEGAKDIISQNALKTLEQVQGIGKTVQQLILQQEEAQQLGQSLKDLLQTPKLRGNYGETILEELLSRILPNGLWERQFRMDGGEIVDCVVRFKDIYVPIDAKFPRDDYLRYSEAETDNDKSVTWKQFETAIKTQISSIKSKYIKPENGTSEFALMFIPSEAIYYETIAENNRLGQPSSLSQYAQDNHVLPVGPNTFFAFLQVVLMSLKNVEIVRNARQLQLGLYKLEKDFKHFYDRFHDIGIAVERASQSYRVSSGHIDKYKQQLDETLQFRALEKEGDSPTISLGEYDKDENRNLETKE